MIDALLLTVCSMLFCLFALRDKKGMLKEGRKAARVGSLLLMILSLIEVHFLYGNAWEYAPDCLAYSILLFFSVAAETRRFRDRIVVFGVLSVSAFSALSVPRLCNWPFYWVHVLTALVTSTCCFVFTLRSVVRWINDEQHTWDMLPRLLAGHWSRMLGGWLLMVLSVLTAWLSVFPLGRFLVILPGVLLSILYGFLLSGTSLVPMWKVEQSLAAPAPAERRNEGEEVYYKSIFAKCCRFMETKHPFLVDSFSLSDLAAGVFTNKIYVSKAIAKSPEVNFRRFVNHYRVRYAQDLFRENMSLRVVDLAMLSGCKSIQTFCAVFKKFAGETPRTWCNRTRKLRFRQ